MYLKLYKAISCILCLGRDIYYAKYYGGGGGENGRWEKKKKRRIMGKNENGETKREENYIKNGGKGFKNASFRVVN